MKTFVVIRVAVIFVLCVVAWYLMPWPVALLLTILAAGQEMQSLIMHRLLCFVSTVQKVHRNTPAGGADNGRQAG